MTTATAAYVIFQNKPENPMANFNMPVWLGGEGTPDGDATPWKEAPVGSMYTNITDKTLYQKTAANDADADWVQMQAVLSVFSYLTSGTGVPAGTLPAATYPKGTIYVQTNAADDAVAVFVRVDDAGDAGDWKSLAYSA